MSWQKERLAEDVQREEALLNQAKNLFNIQKQEFVKYLSEMHLTSNRYHPKLIFAFFT